MKRCTRCLIPDSRPDTQFVNGVCSACLAYDERSDIDWEVRKGQLEALLERGRNDSGFDCVVPSSGGKDSTFIVLTLIDLGARPLVVTASTCHLTPIGRANIENLKRYATTVEVSACTRVRALLNKWSLRLVGDISWPEHAIIHTMPFKIAAKFGIPLVMYGENPTNQYGGPREVQAHREMTMKWVSEFGGFLGLRATDFIGFDGISEQDMYDYQPVLTPTVEAHFLGYYVPWHSHVNARVALDNGMSQKRPCVANHWTHENLDNAQTGIHDHMMYRKYGYGRACAQVSVDIRSRTLSRAAGATILESRDGCYPYEYCYVRDTEIMADIGMPIEEYMEILQRFTNWELFSHVDNQRPILKEGYGG